jgi:hypothetical protein
MGNRCFKFSSSPFLPVLSLNKLKKKKRMKKKETNEGRKEEATKKKQSI